jgi:hypothetical protein
MRSKPAHLNVTFKIFGICVNKSSLCLIESQGIQAHIVFTFYERR